MFSTKGVVLLGFSILFLGLIGFSQSAYAVGGTISDQTSCEALGLTWASSNRCQVSGLQLEIVRGDVLTINSGIRLDVSSNSTGVPVKLHCSVDQVGLFDAGLLRHPARLRYTRKSVADSLTAAA